MRSASRNPRSRLARAWVIALLAGAASQADATQHLVPPGGDWSKMAERARPGDEIILMPGVHRGVRLEGLAGTAEKPIHIRPADPKVPARIEADEVGVHLVHPAHVVLESLIVVGAKRCGVLIEGAPGKSGNGVELKSVYVANTGDRGERDAVRVAHVNNVSLDRCRIEGWHRAGLHLHGAETVAVRNCEFTGGSRTPDRIGIAIDGGSRDVIVERTKFGQGLVMALALGLPETDALPPKPDAAAAVSVDHQALPALAESIVIERCISDRPARFAAFGSCRSTTVRANTILSPTALWEVAAVAKGWCTPEATIVSNLTAWEPSTLQRFALAAPGAVPAGIAVEINLWWSPELAATKSLLGDFVGTLKADQVTTVDPKLDTYFNPQAEQAKAFGREAP